MNNKYINELIEKLEYTEVWSGTVIKCQDYNEGINLLLDTFTVCKERQSRLSSSETAAVLR